MGATAGAERTGTGPEPAERLLERLARARGHPARAPIRARLRACGREAVPALLGALSRPEPLMRWEAVNLLGDLAPGEATETMVSFALDEDDRHARWRAFWALSRLPRARTVPLLLEALEEGEPSARRRAALALSVLDRSDGLSVLRAELEGDDDWRRWEAASALGALGGDASGTEDALARLLAPETAPALRRQAVLSLGRVGTERAFRHLREAVSDPEPEVRWRASMSLARAGPDALPTLRRRMEEERDPKVRAQLREDIERLEVMP